jgi:uncharacterized protein (TIGR03067 family)
MLTAGLGIIALAVGAPAPPDDAHAKALKALQGTWKLVAVEEKGGELKDNKDSDLHFTFEGNALLWREGKPEPRRFRVKVDPSKSPARIDITAEIVKGQTRTAHAVYEVKGDRLTICFGHNANPDEPEDRPRELKTGDADQRPQKGKLMFVFKRVEGK